MTQEFIDLEFSLCTLFRKLISVLKSVVSRAVDITNSKEILLFKTMKCLQYVTRFVSRSRILFKDIYPEDDPEDDFNESLTDLLQNIIYLMSSSKDSLLREQGACLKYLPSTIKDILLVFDHVKLR